MEQNNYVILHECPHCKKLIKRTVYIKYIYKCDVCKWYYSIDLNNRTIKSKKYSTLKEKVELIKELIIKKTIEKKNSLILVNL